MKKHLFLTLCLLTATIWGAENLSAQTRGLTPAEKLTEKGFIGKKSMLNPDALDSLLKCDKYVMLISSFEGCTPCEWLRTSDVFDRYPITPYYNDMLLNPENATLAYTFPAGGFPTCLYFDPTGEIVAVTAGTANLYARLDRIVEGKERICEYPIKGVPEDRILPLVNCSYKATAAYLKGEMEDMYKYATEAMDILPGFYNRYLLYKYYSYKKDAASADKYKALALENLDERDKMVYKKLIDELNR